LNPVRGGAIGKRKGDAMQKLFARNKTWSDRIKEINPDFFTNLARQQKPEYLWIGCADSRVPANQIVDLPPGEVFVHRNIANVVVPTDLNCLSVLQYAVEVLRVRAVIVCGHYGCGGIDAALADQELGLIDNWLNHIRAVHRLHKGAFEACADDPAARSDLLCELNVVEQVNHVCDTTIVRHAWAEGRDLPVYGAVYRLKDGILNQLCVKSASKPEGVLTLPGGAIVD
jgi:carbonic anhydrase